ncbi:mitochondrial Mrb1 [Dacryopinax primogenitus]|uniref:Mitochondrial Mrb1 n=1 Tax=Dacryopinax primogenitus (strain DJM 731) TaxID=1858805 RepID=M5FWI7_DACPD|nr:mitochondrial Mrb1 [Dacryopinax primogenitus]EJU02301.1 mitochondrial Mrb1 [Dacryopinax primogenitus]
MSALRAFPAATSMLRSTSRPLLRSILRTTLPAASRLPVRAFSATRLSRSAGESDVALSSRLKEEIKYEAENSLAAEPEFLKEFKGQNVWEIRDKEGHDDVELLRTFGNETIKVFFSIADIDNEQPQFEGEEGAEEPPQTYSLRCSATISKPSGGALVVELMSEEGTFIIDGVSYYSDARLGTEMSANAEWERRGMYIGPQFDNLDVQVQEEFEKYIQERGITDELASFIPDYAEYKEQKEYVKWLNSVTKFVDA